MNIAMKPIYLLLIPALALAACSQDDAPGIADTDGSNRIVFRTSVPELVSRAQVITTQNLPYFCVTAFDFEDETQLAGTLMKPLFANEKVDITSGNSYSSPYCCWPDRNKENHVVSFYAFYPELTAISEDTERTKLVNSSAASAIDYKLRGFRVAEQIPDHLDFVTAYTSGTMAENLFSGVILPFAHQLSRVEIKAYGAHQSCDIEIAGVRIGGIGVEGTFDFKPVNGGGVWEPNPTRGIVEYIFSTGDKIVSCGHNHKVIESEAISIMGTKPTGDVVNSAMLIPSTYASWDHTGDRRNAGNKMYISVLLRVTDATPTAGVNPLEKQRYPYRDLTQGADALDVPIVYIAVDKATGEVATRLYKSGNRYFTDSKCLNAYTVPSTEEVKEFGWAAIPVSAEWQPGYIYTYYLDYTYGVGLLDPEVSTGSPGAGDPVISDKVGFTYTVKEWIVGGSDNFTVPGS